MKVKTFTVYKHTCPNGKVYVGITCAKNLHERFRDGNGYGNCKRFSNAIKKYGWENIKHEVLLRGLTHEEACAKEIELIEQLKATNPEFGYNILLGGNLSALGRHWKLSEEAIQNHREAAYWKGKRIPDEIRKKMSITRKGRPAQNKRKVICVDTGQVFPSITEAAKQLSASPSSICNCLSRRTKTAGGYRWRYE